MDVCCDQTLALSKTVLLSSFTAQSEAAAAGTPSRGKAPMNGSDIYENLDHYFQDVCQEIALGIPDDDASLVHYLIPAFNRFSAGAQSANRLLNYINRHYVKRAVDEDRGWLRLNDVLESVAKGIHADNSREKISTRLRDKRKEELKKWGYAEGDSSDRLALAESSLEAASDADRIVPIVSLAHRRFRIEVFDPLLAVPKTGGKGNPKGKHRIPKSPTGAAPYRPKGRLARAVHSVMTADDIEESERLQLIKQLSHGLQTTGVRPDHSLRKRIDKYISTPDSRPLKKNGADGT